jgi:hypothetical protein
LVIVDPGAAAAQRKSRHDRLAAVGRGASLDDLLSVPKAELGDMVAEGCGGIGAPAALRLAQEQFDTPAFRAYLAGKLGLV